MKYLIYKLLKRLYKLQKKEFSLINSKLNKMANQNERVQAALAKITEATTGIASDIRELKDKIAAGEVTEETLAGLEQAAASLEAMDAENPTGTGGEVPPDGGTSTDEGAEG